MRGPRPRSDLHSVPIYAASRSGGTPTPEPLHLLAANENPYDPLPGVLDAAIAAAGRFNRYPDLGCERLIDALAHRFDLPPTRFATGTGSVGVAQSLIQALAAPGDEVMYAWRSFEAYPAITAICGGTAVGVPLADDARHDLDAMAKRVTERTRLIFVCTPNNPTGTAVRRDELAEFLDRVPEDVLVVLDEAYAEFVRDKDAVDGTTVCREYPNVAVLRTFSKAFGLAGLRIGFSIAPEPVAAALRTTAVPYGVSQMAQEAAIASLAAGEELMKRVDLVVAERQRMEDALIEQGWPIPRSQANFVWLPLRERSAEFAGVCARAGIAVRALAEDGVRVSIGARESNDLFLETAARIRPGYDHEPLPA